MYHKIYVCLGRVAQQTRAFNVADYLAKTLRPDYFVNMIVINLFIELGGRKERWQVISSCMILRLNLGRTKSNPSIAIEEY